MAKHWKSIKLNILAGYFALVLIATATVWIIYSETIKLTDNEVDISPVRDKIFIINSILTNLYDAEGLERSYLLTGNSRHFSKYNELMDSISVQVKTLGMDTTNLYQKNHTDSIQNLLGKKRQNLEELIAAKNAGSSEKIYERAMVRLAANQDSIDQLLNIYKTITTSKDSIIVKQTRKKFFERLVNVFSPQEKPDTTLKIVINESLQIDSIMDVFNPADSVAQLLTTVIEEIREESKVFETQLLKKEREILENDQTITLQIRQMLAQLENEELLRSLKKVEQQQSHIQNITTKVIFLGAVALIIVVVFIILILNDITKSHLYRKNLEKEKAYSEALLKSKEQLMMSITHDLKSPLSSIMGFSKLISTAEYNERQKNYLRNIETSAEYILRLINDLLDFARLESGRLKIEKIKFNFAGIMEEVITGFYPLARSKNLWLEVDLKNLPDTDYLSDPVRIKQVLNNLISNAIKFTEKGGVNVNCSVAETKDLKDFIKIEVTDTGIGISDENLENIFEEFSRGSLNGNSKYEGTGLGLAISKKIIELLDGQIQVESKNNEGSRFTIFLPLKRQNSMFKGDDKLTERETVQVKDSTKYSMNGEKVLLIDDDPVLLGMTAEMLNTAGIRVEAFTSQFDALSALKKEKFKILITDILMPQMNGFELLSFYRQNNQNGFAIAVTGESHDSQIYIEAGFDSVIKKPFTPNELLSQIYSRLNSNKNSTPEIENKNAISSVNYNIKGITAFTNGDPDSVKNILISFIQSTNENLKQFNQHLQNENPDELSELAHKMLAMFRQLNAVAVAKQLAVLEENNFKKPDLTFWRETAKTAQINIVNLVQKLKEDFQIS